MPGNLNSSSVIWTIGTFASGYNANGELVALDSIITDTATEAYADAAVDVLHDRLVASGILES